MNSIMENVTKNLFWDKLELVVDDESWKKCYDEYWNIMHPDSDFLGNLLHGYLYGITIMLNKIV